MSKRPSPRDHRSDGRRRRRGCARPLAARRRQPLRRSRNARSRAPARARERRRSGSSSRRSPQTSSPSAAPVSVLDRRLGRALHGVARRLVTPGRPSRCAQARQTKPGVLARAIVVQGGRRPRPSAPARAPPFRRAANARRRRARSASAPALASIAAAPATCAGSPECEAQASAISASLSPSLSAAPLSTQRQRLKRLDRRARKDRALDVAERECQRAAGIDDRAGAAMARFDQRAARDFDDDRIGHRPLRSLAAAVRDAAIDSLYKARRRDSSAQATLGLRDVNGAAPRLQYGEPGAGGSREGQCDARARCDDARA